MVFHGHSHGSVALTCGPLANQHSQLSKVVPVRKYHTMKAYGGMDIQLGALLTAAQDGGKWSNSRPDLFIPDTY
jgi:hypothetical protein